MLRHVVTCLQEKRLPELPEVETTRRGIAPHISGQTVAAVTVHEKRLRWPVPDTLGATLQGEVVTTVQRRGKYLLLQIAQGTVIVHLGMSGSLRIVERGAARRKHDHIEIAFSNGYCLRYHDPRRFGCMLFSEEPLAHPLLASLGPEPLGDTFSAEYLFERSRGRTTAIKSFIMDSRVVVGVGNIYANEALFLSGIHPKRAAGHIALARYQRLAAHIRQVLAAAIEAGGTTLRDFVNGNGEPGYFQQTLNVYGRGGQPCTACGATLKEVRLAQRSTVYCAACQR